MCIKRTILLLACLCCILCSNAQNVVNAEYFIDDDPGTGKGKALKINTTDSIINLTDSIPAASLTPGFHTLSIRTKDIEGHWSFFKSRTFFITGDTNDVTLLSAISKAEYFIDEDPGAGKGKNLLISTGGNFINLIDSIPAATITPGFHTLSIRIKNAQDNWSFFESRTFFVSGDTVRNLILPAINKAEYFIDKDPGAGRSKTLSIGTSDTAISLKDSILAASLAPGFHTFSMRTKNAEGRWGLFESRAFFVSKDTTNNSTLPAITKAEYFIDEDPGIGKGKILHAGITDTVISIKDSISADLASGFHTLSIRTNNLEGRWSQFESRTFFVSGDTNTNKVLPTITKAEYFIDEDPGAGRGKNLAIGKSDTAINIRDSILTDSLKPGFHTLSIRTKNAEGRWGFLDSKTFFVSDDTTNNTTLPAISNAEYFIDKDPGIGEGKVINITTSDTAISFKDSLPASLTTGFHTLSIRIKNGENKWSLFESRTFSITPDTTGPGILTAIANAEYFIDEDPGEGKGKVLNINLPDTAVTIQDSIPLFSITNLTFGFHTLCIRVKNAEERWSLFESRTFFITPDTIGPGTLPAITEAQYFIDEDPGTGKGKTFTIGKSDTAIIIQDSLSAASLKPGFHSLSTRTKNAEGHWSLFESRTFFVSGDTTSPEIVADITKAEYFIDNDPGTGKSMELNINTIDTVINIKDSFPSPLNPGFHTLSIRTKNAESRWSLFETRTFFVSGDTADHAVLPAIIKAEYFIDEDPGAGKGKTLNPDTLNTNISLKDSILLPSPIKPGFHTLSIRAKNAEGRWNLFESRTFFISGDTSDNTVLPAITKAEYFMDNDPGAGKGISFVVANPGTVINQELTLPLHNGIKEGLHFLFTRFKNANGKWSQPEVDTFTVDYVQKNDLGIAALIAPFSTCNLGLNETIKVQINNFGNVLQDSFRVGYQVNNGPVILEKTDSSVLNGKPFIYSFKTKANLSAAGTHNIRVFTQMPADIAKTNDTMAIKIENITNFTSPLKLLPSNNLSNLDIPITFSWNPVNNAATYDLYIWAAGDSVSLIPTLQNITQINVTYGGPALSFGTTYQWKVIAKRFNCVAESVTQIFTTRRLPDVVINSINSPAKATSETGIEISWNTKNIGKGGTGSTRWYESAYISEGDSILGGNDQFIGSSANLTALNPGISYNSSKINYIIPLGYQGRYYILVRTNTTGSLRETTDTNNITASKAINVLLAPPPDLQVTNLVVSPATLFSEGAIAINYTVSNKGTGPTSASAWSDYIFLSESELFNINDATFLGSFNRSKKLEKDSSYAFSNNFNLPPYIEGTYYVYVFTDRFAQVFEASKEDNNTTRSIPIEVVIKPYPNLVVSNGFVQADTVSIHQPLGIEWTTKNEGAGNAKPYWTDVVYMSRDTTFLPFSATLLGTLSQNDTLKSLSGKSSQLNIAIPGYMPEGNYVFYVMTDYYNQVFEGSNNNDNISAPFGKVRVVYPDLKATKLIAPDSAKSTTSISASWSVSNIGRVNLYKSDWTDQVYLSKDTSLSTSQDMLLTTINNNEFIAVNGQYTRQQNITIPRGLSGKYYLLLKTDMYNNLAEKLETNNIIWKSIVIDSAQYPDLQITAVSTKATDTIGTTLSFTYKVANKGDTKIISQNWYDLIYLTTVNNANTSNRIYLTAITRQQSLEIGEDYSQLVAIQMPTHLSAGKYYVIVETDAYNQVYEDNQENNNRRISGVIDLKPLPHINLVVVSGTVSSRNITAGQPVQVTYTVKNKGNTATFAGNWYDAVYLSNNPVLDANDLSLTSIYVNTQLQPGSTYTQTRTIYIPQNANGIYYLLVNADLYNASNDSSRNDNIIALMNGGINSIVISQPIPTDLQLQSLKSPSTGVTGQPVTVSWSVKNKSKGATNGSWNDNVYLSKDFQLSGDDQLVGSFTHHNSLKPDSSYSNTQQVILPFNTIGNYVLIVAADGYNAVYEINAEENNTAGGYIFIYEQRRCDLAVRSVEAPREKQVAGATTSLNWTLQNKGFNPANGYLTEAVYLSADSIWDIKDPLFGTLESNISIAGNDTLKRQLSGRLSNVTLGNYYVIVRTDIVKSFVEVTKDNNKGSSDSTFSITFNQLPLNINTYDSLFTGQPLYYRLEIPAGLIDQTLSVKLEGDPLSKSVNRIFVSYQKVPTANTYDFASEIPFEANQEIIIPALKKGTYYLMVAGQKPLGRPRQDIRLLAKTILFNIASINANTSGNTGFATIKVTGARFDNATTFRLEKNGLDTIYPAKTYLNNSTQAFVVFDLKHAKTGIYDVVANNTKTDTALKNGFTIIKGPGSGFGEGTGNNNGFVCQIVNIGFEDLLDTDLDFPASIAPNRPIGITVYYENKGTIDIPVPLRYFVSLSGAPVAFTSDDLKKNEQQLILELKEEYGPPDILRPGAKGFIKIYSTSTGIRGNQVQFSIIE